MGDWTKPQNPSAPVMPQTFFFGGRRAGKNYIMRLHLYDIWQRYKAGESVEVPYVIGPGWKPPRESPTAIFDGPLSYFST